MNYFHPTKFLIFSFLLIHLLSCRGKVSIAEYIALVNKCEQFKRISDDGVYHTECLFRPARLLALQELNGELHTGSANAKDLMVVEQQFSNAFFFILRIGLKDGSDILRQNSLDIQQYNQKINYLSSIVQNDIYLISEINDTVRTGIVDLQRSFGLSPEVTLMLSFPKADVENFNTFELIYHDRLFGLDAPLKFAYTMADINYKLPEINNK